MTIACCDEKQIPHADKSWPKVIDKPNIYPIPSGAWETVTCKYASVLVPLAPLTDGKLIAIPEMERAADVTEIHESTADGKLYLHAPGIWRVRSTGAAVRCLLVDAVVPEKALAELDKDHRGYTVATHSAPTAGVASGVILAANINRRYALLVNDSNTDVYLALGVAAALNTGIRINANGGSYELSGTNLWKGVINGISGVAGKIVLVTEGT